MKKFFYLLIALVFSLGIVSCSDDEDSSNPLVGTWVEKDSYEWFEYTFNKNYTGRFYSHYTDSEGKHLEGFEIEKTFTYELNIEKNGVRITPVTRTAYRYDRNGILCETADTGYRNMEPYELSFEIQHKYEGEYILILIEGEGKYADITTLYKK